MEIKVYEEFKTEAIRLGEQEGISSASAKLGIGIKTLYAFQRAERLERGEAPEGLRSGESAEQGFRRLEREVRELRDANYILKKAMSFMVGRYRSKSSVKSTHGFTKTAVISA